MRINNDIEFKTLLDRLDVPQQRRVGAAFVDNVLPLCKDVRISAAIGVLKHPSFSDVELDSAYQAANTARIESFSQCGHEADWRGQAGHFVAKAALCCVRPAEQGVNLAWEAAMAARMARTCESIADGGGTDNHEAENQYRILYDLMNS